MPIYIKTVLLFLYIVSNLYNFSLFFQEYVSKVQQLFPYITLVLTEQNWPPQIPATVTGLSQRVALHLNTASLPKGKKELHSLLRVMDRYDLLVNVDTKSSAEAFAVLKELMSQHTERANTNLYVISH